MWCCSCGADNAFADAGMRQAPRTPGLQPCSLRWIDEYITGAPACCFAAGVEWYA